MSVHDTVNHAWQESFSKLNREQPGITGLLQFSRAWTYVTDFLRPYDIDFPNPKSNAVPERLKEALELINECRRLPHLLETFQEDIKKHAHLLEREINTNMATYMSTNDSRDVRRLVKRLVLMFKAWAPLNQLGEAFLNGFRKTFHQQLYSHLPLQFLVGFKALIADTLPRSDSDSATDALNGRENEMLWEDLEILGLVDRFESIVASVAYEHIENHVLDSYTEDWAEPVLPLLRDWMAGKMLPWMLLPYARGARTSEEAKQMLHNVGSRFDFHMNKTLCDLRTREIFDIIVDFPDSNGALRDLKECLSRIDDRSRLVQALRSANHRRLLHPGANTKDILQQYVQTIRSLRIIDPPGVLLHKVANPIRQYLRDRPDTIRCIVASLIVDGESGDSLVDESEPIRPLQTVEVEDYTDPQWNPEPIDAGPDFRSHRPSDIISTLVSIYDSQDLLVKELQRLLAKRLLEVTDGDYEKDYKNVELLKLRFGEALLQVCEVMLKDMTDSRRIDQHVQSRNKSVLHPTIISSHFWPEVDDAVDMKMPGQLLDIQKHYSDSFSTFKPDKKLRWLPHLGEVFLELQLKDRTLEFHVPPLEAAMIELFAEQESWSIDELAERLGGVDRTSVGKSAGNWQDRGVLKRDPDREHVFLLCEVQEESSAERSEQTAAADLDNSEEPTAQELQNAESLRTQWKFVEAMLTNLGGMPLTRMHAMMKIAPDFNLTIDQFGSFLESARRHGLVTIRDGLYRLNK